MVLKGILKLMKMVSRKLDSTIALFLMKSKAKSGKNGLTMQSDLI